MTAPVARLLHTLHRLAPDGVTARVPVADLAAAVGLQVRRVQQLTRDAEARGLLAIETQAGRGHANTYALTPAALEMVQLRDETRATEEASALPVAPFTAEKVQPTRQMVQRKGATRPEMVQSSPEKVQSNGAKMVQSAAMNDSYPEDSKSLSLKRTTQALPGESHSLAPIAPFSAEAEVAVSQPTGALANGALPRLLVANGFAGANVATLARLAREQGADTDDVLKACRWAERQETRGRIANWHAYLVTCVKADGWKSVAARADARDPLTPPGGRALDTAAGISQLLRDLGIDDDRPDDRSPNGLH